MRIRDAFGISPGCRLHALRACGEVALDRALALDAPGTMRRGRLRERGGDPADASRGHNDERQCNCSNRASFRLDRCRINGQDMFLEHCLPSCSQRAIDVRCARGFKQELRELIASPSDDRART